MDPELREQIIEECKQRCTCQCYQNCHGKRRNCKEEEEGLDDDQRTFLTFITETISVIAFLIFGSVVFWLAVGGILFDFVKRLYYTDRYVKVFIGVLLSIFLLSMTARLYRNRGYCRLHNQIELEKKFAHDARQIELEKKPAHGAHNEIYVAEVPVDSHKTIKTIKEPPKPPPDYLKIIVKDKKLQIHVHDGQKDNDLNGIVTKKFTLTIVDEDKKEVFRTSKPVFIPRMALENSKPPALVVHLKELIIDDY